MPDAQQPTALGGVVVLELGDDKAVYCGKLLADLGARVILIEKPGGHPMRRLGPFVHDNPHPERSLYFMHFNTNKESITLDIEKPDGRNLLKRLVSWADIILESFSPGYLDSRGLGYSQLQRINSGLILTSVTPFGQTGPWRNHKGCNLTVEASGGLLYQTGFPGQKPFVGGAHQSYHIASLWAAVGTLVAVYAREFTGEGQHVDVSMQETIPTTLVSGILEWELQRVLRMRKGLQRVDVAKGFFKTKDSRWVCWVGNVNRPAILSWMAEEGFGQEIDITDEKWKNPAYTSDPGNHQRFNKVLEEWCLTRTAQEWYMEGGQRGALVAPVQNVDDLVNDSQLRFRQWFTRVEHDDLGVTLTYPGAPYKLSLTPWSIRCRAPHIGEHNRKVYQGELGLSAEDLRLLTASGSI